MSQHARSPVSTHSAETCVHENLHVDADTALFILPKLGRSQDVLREVNGRERLGPAQLPSQGRTSCSAAQPPALAPSLFSVPPTDDGHREGPRAGHSCPMRALLQAMFAPEFSRLADAPPGLGGLMAPPAQLCFLPSMSFAHLPPSQGQLPGGLQAGQFLHRHLLHAPLWAVLSGSCGLTQ